MRLTAVADVELKFNSRSGLIFKTIKKSLVYSERAENHPWKGHSILNSVALTWQLLSL